MAKPSPGLLKLLQRKNEQPNAKKRRPCFPLKRSKGQHLLTSEKILNNLVRSSKVDKNDVVLEIGPGTGNLTLPLARTARKVVAVEIDSRMTRELRKKLADERLLAKTNVINADFFGMDVPFFTKCVSNVPYNLSSRILFRLLSLRPPKPLAILFQKEFADRIVAIPGEACYSRLSACVRLVASASIAFLVKRRHFVPPPQVDSAFVLVKPKDSFQQTTFPLFAFVTRLIFNRKNKTLRAIFMSNAMHTELVHKGLNLSKEEFLQKLSEVSFKVIKSKQKSTDTQTVNYEEARARMLDPLEIMKIVTLLQNLGVKIEINKSLDEVVKDID